jgi:hypothetical protein
MIEPLEMESEIEITDCLPALAHSDVNESVNMHVLDLSQGKIVKLPALSITVTQKDAEYGVVMRHVPCPELYFVFIAELIIEAKSKRWHSRRIFRYTMEWKEAIKKAKPEHRHIVLLSEKLKSERQPVDPYQMHYYNAPPRDEEPKDYMTGFEFKQSVEVHLIATFAKDYRVGNPYLMASHIFILMLLDSGKCFFR